MPWIMRVDLTIGDASETVDAQVIVIDSWLMQQIMSLMTQRVRENRKLLLLSYEMG
jgi:hypothetical protein